MASAAAVQPETARERALMRGHSIEITVRDGDRISALAGRIAPGTRVAVTFLPGEEMTARVATARRLSEAGFIPVPHIAARRLRSAAELDVFLAALTGEAGVDCVFVIAGDLAATTGPYADALAVIRSGLLVRHGIAEVGIAGYPEGHPDIGRDTLETALRDKVRALRDAGHRPWITTQFGFDADPILTWLERLRSDGIDLPVRIGLAGPASVQALLRFAARCGVGVSARVLARYGLSLTRLVGTAGPGPLVSELAGRLDAASHGEVRLHFYPFGGLDKTADWIGAYSG